MKTNFQARVTLDLVSPNDVELREWTCNLTFFDADGAYTGTDILLGDVLSIDTSPYESGTFSFYTVTSIVSNDPSTPVIIVQYVDNQDHVFGPPDLSAVFGSDAMISRPSTNFGLLPVVSTTLQNVSDKFTEYVQNYNFTKIVDNLQAGDRTFSKINDTAGPMLKGMVVYITELDDTKCKTGIATSYETAHVAGLIADAVVPTGVAGEISSKGMLEKTASEWDIITGDVGGLKGGKDYFLRTDFAGGLTSVPPAGSGQFVVKVGKAISSTVIDINIEPPIQL